MAFERASGVLLHPTSFPGHFGIGDLGPAAYEWVDFLVSARQQLWQILPLGPTGYGDSPYQCFSAFAGNPYLVSPEKLAEDGLLAGDDLQTPRFPPDRVDYGAAINWKLAMLDRVYQCYKAGDAAPHISGEFEAFCKAQAAWLDDFALFMALKDEHGGAVWNTWDSQLVQRRPAALKAARVRLADTIENQRFRQFLFFRQWQALKAYTNARGIRIIGDIPIFVAFDSADVWQHPELFQIDKDGNPIVVAGVPPDYFSATGQLWGNPLYRWDVLKENGYKWFFDRIQNTLAFVDVVRIDHFRGFQDYWEIPANAPTAETGRWVFGPQDDFFNVMRATLGADLPIIAEDLGDVTPEVYELRDRLNLPGMKILQFAWDSGETNPFLPHNYVENCVVYTGTHDNNTSIGWYNNDATEEERDYYRRYTRSDGSDVAWDLIRLAWSSRAILALAPFQDLLNLEGDARMNLPGTAAGNWGWRYRPAALSDWVRDNLKALSVQHGRAADS